MNHEKNFVTEKGRVTISVFVWLSHSKAEWRINSVMLTPPKKRKAHSVSSHDSYEYRRLNEPERRAFELRIFLDYVTKEQINETFTEAWEKLKPVML